MLVNNAGRNTPLPMEEVPLEVLDGMLGSQRPRGLSHGPGRRARDAPDRAEGGAIVNITSQMGHVGAAHRTVYCMTKHALEGLTKAMAVELAPHGIRVNSVAPTFVETPMTRPMLEDPAFARWCCRRSRWAGWPTRKMSPRPCSIWPRTAAA